MPDSITHSFFALDVAQELKINSIKKHKDIYIVGAQGPDHYFFYNFMPCKKSNGIPKVGNLLHSSSTQKFLITFIEKLKKSYIDSAYAFILGWVCHYALDTTAHPYIFYVTGNYDKQDKSTYPYRGNHLQLEKSIDSIFLRRRGYNPNKFKSTKELFTLKELPNEINELLNLTIKETYNLDKMGDKYGLAYKHFVKYHNYMSYDPYGIKKIIYKFLDLFNRKSNYVFKTFSYYNNVNPKIDYLNESNNEWLHPSYDSEVSKDSFMDLYNQAKIKAVDIINKINDFMQNSIDDLTDVIKDITYDTGKDCSDKSVMKYFKSIL